MNIIPGIINTEFENPCSIGPSCPPLKSTIFKASKHITRKAKCKEVYAVLVIFLKCISLFLIDKYVSNHNIKSASDVL